MVYSHSYSTAFYDSYTLITIVIIKCYCYICMSSVPFFRSNVNIRSKNTV
mgnify:CR=1 FL=1